MNTESILLGGAATAIKEPADRNSCTFPRSINVRKAGRYQVFPVQAVVVDVTCICDTNQPRGTGA
jgi:hypothetical protein